MIFVDSDILIEITRGRDQAIISAWESLYESRKTILYSPVSATEIWAGARPDEYESTTQLFLSLECISIGHNIGELAGRLIRLYGKSHSVKIADALIAASAMQNQASLWTRNRKHYPMPELSFY